MTFEQLTEDAIRVVEDTQKRMPGEIRALAKRVAVHYEEEPDEELIEQGFEPDILGLFSGDPVGQEAAHDNPLPPQISLYLANIWDFAEEDSITFREEVRITYLHELGHYLGWDEDEVAARGLD